MKDLMIFNNPKFGEIRSVVIDNEPWFVATDICEILEHTNPSKALQRLDKDERSNFKLGRQGQVNIVNEYGLYNLVLGSRKKEAKEFKRWITHEVLPSIRKTGSYTGKPPTDLQVMRVKIMERNAKVREAKHLAFLAEKMSLPQYKEVLYAKSAEVLTGQSLLPVAIKKSYSAEEIGNKVGISANMVGRIANANNLKVEEYGQLVYDKSQHSDKQVETWRYYENVIPVFERILGKQLA